MNSATVLGEFGNLLDPYIKAINSPPTNEFILDGTETSFATIPKAISLPTPGTKDPFVPGKGNLVARKLTETHAEPMQVMAKINWIARRPTPKGGLARSSRRPGNWPL